MRRIRSRLVTILPAFVLLGLAMVTPFCSVSAASNSLGVNPRRDYIVKSGDKVTDTLNVSNLSKTDNLVITIQLIDFGAKNETGAPQLLLGQKEPTRWSLKPYLKVPSTLSIPAGKSAQVPFTIAIPAGVGAGSYYGAIKYSTGGVGASSNENVSLTSSSATLMFIRVPGEANDSLRLKSFGAFTPDTSGDNGTFGSFYGGSAPKYLAYRVTNNGNVAEQPTGSVAVKNMFGRQIKLFEKANPGNNIVLIDQTRRFDLCFNQEATTKTNPSTGNDAEMIKCNNPSLAPGRYTAQLAIVYGDSGSSSHELRQVASFWYLPIWFIAVVAAVILLIVGVIWLAIRAFSGPRYSANRRR